MSDHRLRYSTAAAFVGGLSLAIAPFLPYARVGPQTVVGFEQQSLALVSVFIGFVIVALVAVGDRTPVDGGFIVGMALAGGGLALYVFDELRAFASGFVEVTPAFGLLLALFGSSLAGIAGFVVDA